MAAAIIASADQQPAPLRIILGSQALQTTVSVLKDRIASFEAQADLAASTDFPARRIMYRPHYGQPAGKQDGIALIRAAVDQGATFVAPATGNRPDRPSLPAPCRPAVPIEDVAGTVKQLITEGKVRPGTRKLARPTENLAAASIELTADGLRDLGQVTTSISVHRG